MPKEIKVVFQDCVTCEPYKTWFEKQAEFANANNLCITKMPFYATGAKEVILAAHAKGVELPFFTDGKKYSRNIADLTEKPQKTKRKSVKKEEKDVDLDKD